MSKLMSVFVYRSGLSDCTNGGASSKAKTVYVRHPEGYIAEADVDPNLVFVEEHRELLDRVG